MSQLSRQHRTRIAYYGKKIMTLPPGSRLPPAMVEDARRLVLEHTAQVGRPLGEESRLGTQPAAMAQMVESLNSDSLHQVGANALVGCTSLVRGTGDSA